MRAALAVVLVAGLVIAGAEAPGPCAAFGLAGFAEGMAAPAPQLQVWLTPPAYTGVAPLFLHPGEPSAPVPAGSHLTVNLTGGAIAPNMSFGDQADRVRDA